MSNLSDTLKHIDSQIDSLNTERQNAIINCPATFEELAVPRYMLVHRYIVIYGDGHVIGASAYFNQRPAAFRAARQGRYVWDRREGKIYNDHGTVVATTEKEQV